MDVLLPNDIKDYYKRYFKKSSSTKICTDVLIEIENYRVWSLKENTNSEIREKSRDIGIDDKISKIFKFIDEKFNNVIQNQFAEEILNLINSAEVYKYDFFNKEDREEDISYIP